jgi:hypothetical protein
MKPDLDSATHCERDDDPANCGIEITAEMIAAGVAALVSYNPRFDLEEDGARGIYVAMVKASKKGK